MVHTAIGFAKANLRLATLACTASIGPGSTNMITGAAAATINRLPVLLFPSDYYATRHQGPVLQQLEHPVSADVSVNDCFRPVSRFFDRITRPEQILTALPEAMRVLTDPAETGAVTIALAAGHPGTRLRLSGELLPRTHVWRVERRPPDPERIARGGRAARGGPAAGDHRRRRRALLGGVAGAAGLRRGAGHPRRRDVRRQGGDAGTHRRWRWAATAWRGPERPPTIVSRADLVICVGTRLTDFATGSQSCFKHPDVRFISINVCGHDAYKQGALPIIADAREALRALHQARQGGRACSRGRPTWKRSPRPAAPGTRRCEREVYTHHEGEAMSQGELIRVLNQEARPGDTVIAAAGGPPGDLLKLWDATGGRACHLEFGYSCMGYEIPAGLGVRLAQPEGEVYRLDRRRHLPDEPDRAGDRGAGGPQDHGRHRREPRLPVHPPPPDVADRRQLRQRVPPPRPRDQPARRRIRADRPGQERRELRRQDLARRDARAVAPGAARGAAPRRGTCVIVAEIEKHRFLPGGGVWWDVAPAEVSHDPMTQKLRAEYEHDRSRLQRFHY